MKKAVCTILAGAVLCGMMAGCSFSSDSQTEYDAFMTEVEAAYWELDAIKPEQVPASFTLETLDEVPEQVLLDEAGVKITFTGMMSSDASTDIRVRVENTSEKAVTVRQQDLSVNGVAVTGMFSCSVAPGKTVNDAISVSSADLGETSITDIDDIALSFVILDRHTLEEIVESDAITIQL